MSRRAVVVVLGIVIVGLSAALWVTSRDTPHAAIDDDENAVVGVRYDYNLMTHCGVDFIRFDGRWWEAQPHLDDGNGNPPDGWDNGIQKGALRLESETALIFNATGDRELRFAEATITPTPQICA